MIEVMLPLALLVAVGGLWTRFFGDTPLEAPRCAAHCLVRRQSVVHSDE
jgi:hypothetical protein